MNNKQREKEIRRSLNRLLQDVDNKLSSIYYYYYLIQESPYVTGAMVSAYKKELKRELFLIYFENSEDLDLTYDITNQLVKRLLGRGISTPYILDKITQKGRKEISKYKKDGKDMVDIIDSIERKYFKSFRDSLAYLNLEFANTLKDVKDRYKNK